MAEKVDQELERIAQEAEYEARQMIPTAGRVITSHDVAVIAARLGRQQGLREAAEVARGKAEIVREKARRDRKRTDSRCGLVLGYEYAEAAISALMEGEGE